MRQNNFFLTLLKVFFFSSILVATSAVRAELKVVTTIKPLHSLIANVMDGIGEPALIIEGSTSPHSFTLKPSHAKLLEEADIICLLYTSPSPRDAHESRMPSSA